MKMTSIYNLRTYCPKCGVKLKPKNIRLHLNKKHGEVSEDKIKRYEKFIKKCTDKYPNERISIDLLGLYVTLLDRPKIPNIEKNHQKNSNPESSIKKDIYIFCNICGKKFTKGNYKQHRIDDHGADPCILKRGRYRKNKVSKFEYPSKNIGRPYQGGSPGLGKK